MCLFLYAINIRISLISVALLALFGLKNQKFEYSISQLISGLRFTFSTNELGQLNLDRNDWNVSALSNLKLIRQCVRPLECKHTRIHNVLNNSPNRVQGGNIKHCYGDFDLNLTVRVILIVLFYRKFAGSGVVSLNIVYIVYMQTGLSEKYFPLKTEDASTWTSIMLVLLVTRNSLRRPASVQPSLSTRSIFYALVHIPRDIRGQNKLVSKSYRGLA